MLTTPVGLLSNKASGLPIAGLIHEWLLHSDGNDTAGSRNWTSNGAITYGTNRDGVPNKAAVFTGYTTYFDFASDLDIGNIFSVSFWIYYDRTKNPMILDKWADGAIAYLFSNGANIGFRLSTGSTTIPNSPAFASNTWYNIIMTRNGTALNYYIDNGAAKSGTASGTGNTIIRNLNSRYNYLVDDTYSVIGKMSDVRIYNRVITSGERTLLYNE